MTVAVSEYQTEIEVEGRTIALHNLDKVFWPQLGLTKADLINYYIGVAPYLLPYLQGRPFIMKPFPDGAAGRSYYRWEIPDYAPEWLRRWPYRTRTGRVIEMLVIAGLPELIWAANQACLEMHPWLSRTDEPEYPDQVVFDLDPGPGAGFVACLDVALWLHEALDRLGLRSYAKATGRHGLHVLVPSDRRHTFREVRAWVQSVANSLAADHPGEVTVDKSLAVRNGKVLIDYSQNGLGKSIAAPYSARATPGATVSTPLTWREVAARRVRPADFTLLTAPQRVRRMGDLLAPLLEGQALPTP